MSLTMYKSNKSNQGSLFSIKFVAKSNKQDEPFKPGGFFINIVKQTGWNEKNHIGKFSGGESVSFKIDQFEAGKILDVIEKNWNIADLAGMQKDRKTLAKQFGFYNMHGIGGNVTHINFVPWQRQTDNEQTGFAFYVTKTADDKNTSFGAALNFGEAITLREYIKLGMEHINLAGYAEDKRQAEERFAKNDEGENGSDEAAPAAKRRPQGRTRAANLTNQSRPKKTQKNLYFSVA